jgi:hypothetical protein
MLDGLLQVEKCWAEISVLTNREMALMVALFKCHSSWFLSVYTITTFTSCSSPVWYTTLLFTHC